LAVEGGVSLVYIQCSKKWFCVYLAYAGSKDRHTPPADRSTAAPAHSVGWVVVVVEDNYHPPPLPLPTKSIHQRPLFNKIVIRIGGLNGLKLQIDFPSHGTELSQYHGNLQAFKKLLEDDGDSFTALKIDSVAATIAPSGFGSPKAQEIYYRLHRLGKGAFASVYQAIEAGSGDLFAMKVFDHPTDKRGRDSRKPKWLEDVEREFSLVLHHRRVGVPSIKSHHDVHGHSTPYVICGTVFRLQSLFVSRARGRQRRNDMIMERCQYIRILPIPPYALARDHHFISRSE